MKFSLGLAIIFLAASSPLCIAQVVQRLAGVAPTGHVAFEYIGVVKQNDDEFETYGFFTYIRGLPDESLFFDGGERNERNARFTFHSSSKMAAKSVVKKVFNLNVNGNMKIYIRSQPHKRASIDRPHDFAIGKQLSILEFRGQSVVSVTSPNRGMNSAVLEARQTKQLRPFSWNDISYAFGSSTAEYRFTHIGSGELEQNQPPIATITIAGRAVAVSPSR